jgi:uncharacterized protein YchJ
MAYAPLYELLPDVAEKETRSITVMPGNHFGLPTGEYGLVEMYCNDEDCDCRRVIIMVLIRGINEPVAYISYGWESMDFYASWYMGKKTSYSELDADSKLGIQGMNGVQLNVMSPQSEIASTVLEMVNMQCLQDKSYTDRLKRHYKQFRDKITEKHQEISNVKTGRNTLCPCGSGKKYKKCCI